MRQFCPSGNTSLSVSSATSSVRLPARNPPAVRLYVEVSGAQCYIRAGDSTVVATTSDTWLVPGVVEVFDLADSANGGTFTHIAGITASGTATLRITTGSGQ